MVELKQITTFTKYLCCSQITPHLIWKQSSYIFFFAIKYFQTSHCRNHIKRKTFDSYFSCVLYILYFPRTFTKAPQKIPQTLYSFFFHSLLCLFAVYVCEFIPCCPFRSDSLIISTINTSPKYSAVAFLYMYYLLRKTQSHFQCVAFWFRCRG